MRFCLEASNHWSPKNTLTKYDSQSQSTHQKHLCSQSDSGGVRKGVQVPSWPSFKPQISPQLRRNSCLFQTLRCCRQGGAPAIRKTLTLFVPFSSLHIQECDKHPAQSAPRSASEASCCFLILWSVDGACLQFQMTSLKLYVALGPVHVRCSSNSKSIHGSMLCRHLDSRL